MGSSGSLKVLLGMSALVAGAGCYFDESAVGRQGRGSSGGGPIMPGPINRPPASNDGGVIGGGGGPSTPTTDANCGAQTYGLQRLPPDILIVLDASGSMNDDSSNMECSGGCGANSKWAVMTPALVQVVQQTQATVNWGLKLYADQNNQCGVSDTVAVPIPASNAWESIQAVIQQRTSANGGVAMGSYTPTRRAEDAAAAYLRQQTNRMNPKFILLATDGMPNCTGTSNNTSDDTEGAVRSVMNAATNGVSTFVVGISAGGAPEMALNRMAEAGGYPRAGTPRYYPVSSAAEFVSALNTLVTVARSCTFPLGTPPPDPSNVAVHANGASVPKTEWTYGAGNMSVTVTGNLCNQLMAGQDINVQILYGCPGVVVE